MPKAPQPPLLQQIATNAVQLLSDVRAGLIAKGWSEAEAAEMTRQWYTSWSAYMAALVSSNVAASAGVAEALIGLARK